MSKSHQQPFWGEAVKKLPADQRLMDAVAEYLAMRIHKNPLLSIADWNDCIDELLQVYDIYTENSTKSVKGKGRTITRRIANKPTISVDQAIYFFNIATKRKWNHVYFTKEQDIMYNNISFYQDPYWHKIKNDVNKRKILEEELNDH